MASASSGSVVRTVLVMGSDLAHERHAGLKGSLLIEQVSEIL